MEYIDRRRQQIQRAIREEHQQKHWIEVHEQLLAIQKKALEVSDPNDADEKEADEVARKVMSGESAEIHGTGGMINRKGDGGAETTPEFQTKLESSKGGGQSLDDSMKSEMESKMGADFSGVKIHTGGEANKMNESVNAKAFTHGQDIYFGKNNSPENKELLVHELVHTVQQANGKVRLKMQRQNLDEPKSGFIILAVTPFYKNPEESDSPNDRHHDLHADDHVEILEKLSSGWTKIRRTEGETILEGYVRSAFVVAENDMVTIRPRFLTKDEIDAYYNSIEKELEYGFFKWRVSDENVTHALALFKELFDTGDRLAFTDVVMRLREKGMLERLFMNMNDSHLKNEYFIVTRLAVFLPPGTLINIANWQAKIEGGQEIVKSGARAGKKFLKDLLNGGDKTKNYIRKPGNGSLNPVDTKSVRQKGINELKAMIGDKDQFRLDVDTDVADYLSLKYDEIAWFLSKGDRKSIVIEMEGLLDLSDAMFELLMSDEPQHPFITGTMLDYAFSAWESFKTAPTANTIKISDSTNTETPLTELLKQTAASPAASANTTSSATTGANVKSNTVPAQAAPPPTDEIKELKDTLKEVVVTEAERVHTFIDTRLFPLFMSDKLLLGDVNKMLQKRRKTQYKLLSGNVQMNDKTSEAMLSNSGSLDRLTWVDLARIWFYELGPKDLTSKINPLTFGNDAWTTQRLKNHPNSQLISKLAHQRVHEKNYESFKAEIAYGTEAFYQSIGARDTTMIFLGSFYVNVSFNDQDEIITFTAYNETSLESGSRFRRDPNAPAGSQANKAGMIESKERGEGPVPIGGTLHCEWIWTEKF